MVYIIILNLHNHILIFNKFVKYVLMLKEVYLIKMKL